MSQEQELNELLSTTRNYEQLSFQRAIAGLYSRLATTLSLALGFIVLLYALGSLIESSEILNFGFIVVIFAVLGDISIRISNILGEEEYGSFLSEEKRTRIIKLTAIGSVIGGTIVATGIIFSALFLSSLEWLPWTLWLFGLASLLYSLGAGTSHRPTLVAGITMLPMAAILFSLPDPYWLWFMLSILLASIVASVVSNIQMKNA